MGQIIAGVTYALPEGTDHPTRADVSGFYSALAKEGLLRKNVLYREGLGGGIYLWESQKPQPLIVRSGKRI